MRCTYCRDQATVTLVEMYHDGTCPVNMDAVCAACAARYEGDHHGHRVWVYYAEAITWGMYEARTSANIAWNRAIADLMDPQVEAIPHPIGSEAWGDAWHAINEQAKEQIGPRPWSAFYGG